MAILGRAGRVSFTPDNGSIQIVGLKEALRAYQQFDARFNKEMRKASAEVAKTLLDDVRAEAGTAARSRQALEVLKGMRVRSDRIPTIKLSGSSPFVSASNPNRDRGKKGGKKVTRGMVFFGAEFGGGATSLNGRTWKVRGGTKQFLPHRGTRGYFFWPTVRKNKSKIAKEFNDAIRNVLKTLADNG